MCSAEPEEGELAVQAFSEACPDFRPEPLPGWAAPFADGFAARTAPERDLGDAFFAVVLRRA